MKDKAECFSTVEIGMGLKSSHSQSRSGLRVISDPLSAPSLLLEPGLCVLAGIYEHTFLLVPDV